MAGSTEGLRKMTAIPRTIRLNAADNLVVAVDTIPQGTTLHGATAAARIMKGHKMAIAPIADGAPVVKFGQTIGFAHGAIQPGEHIHTHNCDFKSFARDYHFAEDAKPYSP
ncbi:MAG: altronate dehydratase, partial [Alphaproteobacteria bacterium]|nr:altronate dehydratase [Alphaproteobacteria bacterium]